MVFFFNSTFSFGVYYPPGVGKGEIDLPLSSRYLISIFSFIFTKVRTDIALVANNKVEYVSS